MWGGNDGRGGNSAPPDGYDRRNSNGGESDIAAAAMARAQEEALAARLAMGQMAASSNPYGDASSGYNNPRDQQHQDAAAAAAHHNAAILYAQRQREMELYALQQQIQDRQVVENEARNRLLEHAARNQMQEYERTRMEMALVAEIQQRDRDRAAAEREMVAQQHSGVANVSLSQQDFANATSTERNMQEQQLRELIAKERAEKYGIGNGDGKLQQHDDPTSLPLPSNKSSTKKTTQKQPAKKNTSPKRKSALKDDEYYKMIASGVGGTEVSPAKKRKKATTTKTASGATKRGKKNAPTNSVLIKKNPGVPTMDDIVPPITDVEYENVEALMSEFCKVPFLAEFSRPVSLLHPELVKLYSKIVHHPMDLGHVCRSIRRREYKNTRAIQLDVWRIFSNSIKFHMHPTNKDHSIPSFISIAMHLKDFFNSLWQEFMLPSDAPPRAPGKGTSPIHSAFQKRAETRKERLPQISSTVLSSKIMLKMGRELESFIKTGGKADKLDKDAILGDVDNPTADIATFIESIRALIHLMERKIAAEEEFTALELYQGVKKCYTEDVFERDILKKMKITQSLDRILGKVFASINEANSRGVNQSSIWGCMAAAIWARESKKKPYWPSIVLGILAPDDQKEDWHKTLTVRNGGRLPDKLRSDLKAAKRRAESGLKKQSSELMSYFLVEFMGTHEFNWVKESDIIESFDPEEDVNIAAAAGNITKKRRSTAFNTKQMTNAIEEGRWALEEFELQLNNCCGDNSDDNEEDDAENDSGYTYDVLCQSDGEADELDEGKEKGNESDIEELNELLASDGVLDYSVEGRKKAKARAVAMKKEKTLLAKKAKPNKAQKVHDPSALKQQRDLNDKRVQREVESRRKKRSRDHEKQAKELERKTKRKKSDKKINPNDIPNKRDRADAIAKGYLMRKFISDSSFNGAAFQPATNIEPSGLLGMALAFRAAAGEVIVVDKDNNVEPFSKTSWEKINTDGPAESAERCERLQDKIDLIEKEMIRLDSTTQQRLALTEIAKKEQLAAQNKILEEDKQVREAMPKPPKKAGSKKAASVKDEVSSSAKPNDVKVEGGDNGSVPKPEIESKVEGNNGVAGGGTNGDNVTIKPIAAEVKADGDEKPHNGGSNGDNATTKPIVVSSAVSGAIATLSNANFSPPHTASTDNGPQSSNTANDEAIARATAEENGADGDAMSE